MAHHKKRGRGSYLRIEDPYGGVNISYRNLTRPPGTEGYCIAPAAVMFHSKGKSLRGLAQMCQTNPGGRYCQMTMNLIRHRTKRAGFKDWPTYDNKPGQEEPEIASQHMTTNQVKRSQK